MCTYENFFLFTFFFPGIFAFFFFSSVHCCCSSLLNGTCSISTNHLACCYWVWRKVQPLIWCKSKWRWNVCLFGCFCICAVKMRVAKYSYFFPTLIQYASLWFVPHRKFIIINCNKRLVKYAKTKENVCYERPNCL